MFGITGLLVAALYIFSFKNKKMLWQMFVFDSKTLEQ